MKTIEEQMSFYQAYHMNSVNKVTHFVGIPLIIYSIFIPMSWFKFSIFNIDLNGAYFFFMIIWIYYLRLNVMFSILVLIPVSLLLYFATLAGNLPFEESLIYFSLSFIGGWIIQLIGHVFEKRKPALVDNFFQIFIAPLFLIAELLFMIGLKKEMEKEIIEKSKKFLP